MSLHAAIGSATSYPHSYVRIYSSGTYQATCGQGLWQAPRPNARAQGVDRPYYANGLIGVSPGCGDGVGRGESGERLLQFHPLHSDRETVTPQQQCCADELSRGKDRKSVV